MKAILDIPEKEIQFILDNMTYNQFRIINNRPNDKIPMISESYTTGEPITLITSNMPDALKERIVEIISQYCNH